MDRGDWLQRLFGVQVFQGADLRVNGSGDVNQSLGGFLNSGDYESRTDNRSLLWAIRVSFASLRGCLRSFTSPCEAGLICAITGAMSTRCYDTDLNDAAWAWIAPYLPAARPGGRSRTTNLRAVP